MLPLERGKGGGGDRQTKGTGTGGAKMERF